MGDPLHDSAATGVGVSSRKRVSKGNLVAVVPKGFPQTINRHVSLLNIGRFSGGVAWDAAIFLLKVAALEGVRRVSRAKCPSLWNVLQALQCLCYPPLNWIQRWTPFKGLIRALQTLSRPLLVLSIATAFSDQTEFSHETLDSSGPSDVHPEPQSEPPSSDSQLDTRVSEESPQPSESEDWLRQIHEELEKQQIILPERINEDELHRFYAVANGDFSRFLSSIKKTIRWRETYRILPEEELERWSNVVFWHGFDLKHRPCLIVRLGLACLKLPPNERPLFAQAVEHGVLHLVDPENSEITVLVDCEGLSPLRIPMQMMRSCSSILQDHFPNRLGSLFVIRVPPVVRVIAQTFIQVLRPTTRKKLRIEGEMFQRVLSEYLETLPSFLGGDCNCKRCSNFSRQVTPQSHKNRSNKKAADIDVGEMENDLHMPGLTFDDDLNMTASCQQVLRTAVIGMLMLWLFIALLAGLNDPENFPF